MTWVTWRQQRAEFIALTLVIAVIAAFVVATGVVMRGFGGGLACLSLDASPACGGIGDFNRAFGWLQNLVAWFNVLPLLIGVFIGGPLLGREIERGTHRLAWTQSVTRTRWIGMKLAVVVGVALAVGAALAGMLAWWRQPFDLIDSPFSGGGFDVEALMPGVYVLFALSLGAAAGAVTRKVLPAMAVTIPAFLAVRLPIEFWLRPHYMSPITAIVNSSGGGAPPGAWVLDNGLIDAAGTRIYASQATQLCGNPATGALPKSADACLQAHGILERVVYQPLDRFWPFQFIEAGIYVAVSVALLTLTVYWVRSRIR
ncbi:MAG: transporter [Candidatus Dormibacteria bacterium]